MHYIQQSPSTNAAAFQSTFYIDQRILPTVIIDNSSDIPPIKQFNEDNDNNEGIKISDYTD